jgi:hypothetical protein
MADTEMTLEEHLAWTEKRAHVRAELQRAWLVKKSEAAMAGAHVG